MELKFECHNCGKEHTTYGTNGYQCGQIHISFNLIIAYKIMELEKYMLAIVKGLPKLPSKKNQYERGKPGIWRQE